MKRKIGILVLAVCSVLVFGVLGCRSARDSDIQYPPPNSGVQAPASSEEYLQVGDKIEVFVMEDESFNGVYVVREKGDLIMPKVGRVVVKGLTIAGAERKIQSTLEGEGDQLTKATVIADRIARAPGSGGAANPGSTVVVFMTGRAARPGQHKIPVVGGGTVGVFEAITIAGGITRLGDERKVHVLRKGTAGNRVKIPIDLRKIKSGKSPDPPIGNGDIIVVPEARFLPL